MPDPLRPRGPAKGRDAAEDAELLKLVGAALDSTRTKPKKRRVGFFGRIRRLRSDMDKAVQRHPFVATGMLLGSAALVYLLGVAITSYSQNRKADQGLVEARGRGRSGASSGGSAVRRPRTVKPGDGPGSGRVTDPELAESDVVKDLIVRVIAGNYEYRSDIATGRFLRDFQSQRLIIVHVNPEMLRPARRGKDWLQVRGPYATEDTPLKTELTRSAQRFKRPTEALVRVVKEDDVWKLEHARVY